MAIHEQAAHKGSALITGASTGIGSVYADRLARRGYDLILVARSRDKLDALARRIGDSTGRAVEVIAADLNNSADLARIEAVLRSDARITLLVNNAGVGSSAKLLESDVEKMHDMITLNVTALTRLTYAAVPAMVQRGRGELINIASIVGIAPEILNGVYGATKAYVIALTQSLHHEHAEKGLHVQAVLPGATATPFWDIAGTPIEHLPAEWVMSAEDMVDASLAGFDQRELLTIPALPEAADLAAYEAARQKLMPNLSRSNPAARYLNS
jgi:short-subunit dehydrogenase